MEGATLNLRDQKLVTGEINRLRAAFPLFHELGLKIEQQQVLQDAIRRTRRQVQEAQRKVDQHETLVNRDRARLEALHHREEVLTEEEEREGGPTHYKELIDQYEKERKDLSNELYKMDASIVQQWEDYDRYCVSLSKLRDKELQAERERIAKEKYVTLFILLSQTHT